MRATIAQKERPILFSAEMVRAILDGRKTQTRRIVKPQPPTFEAVKAKSGSDYCWMTNGYGTASFRPVGPVWAIRELMGREPSLRCPYGGRDDRLWVREAWNVKGLCFGMKPRNTLAASASAWRYAATDDGSWQHGWRPSIHMPRWASRITLEITDVRVEQLQAISESDAIAEGVGPGFVPCPHPQFPDIQTTRCVGHRPMFARLWDEINGKGSWESSPWVWAITFKKATALSPEQE